MEMEEYKEEVAILKENLNACVSNQPILEQEVKIVDLQLKSKPNNSELLRLKVKVSDRLNINDVMIDSLKLALRVLKHDQETNNVYTTYLNMYENSAKRFIEISESEEFKVLANKYLDNIMEEVIS